MGRTGAACVDAMDCVVFARPLPCRLCSQHMGAIPMHAISRWALALATAAGLATTAPSVTAQGVFPPPEQFPDLRLEVAGTVNAIARYDDGVATYYLIGGDFSLVNGAPR